MRTVLANSIEGREIALHGNEAFAKWRPDAGSSALTLIIGGTHGDERATVTILENFIGRFLEPGKLAEPVAILSLLNPDGYVRNTRYNARGVDLNRNFPQNWRSDCDEPPGSGPLSEPETLALHDLILRHRPAKIISLHWALAELDADGPQSSLLAQAMWKALSSDERKPYRLKLHENRAPSLASPREMISGSLGQWCGHGRCYANDPPPATITLELPYHPDFHPRPEELPADHLDTVQSMWKASPEMYLAGVEEPVHRMLLAACRFKQEKPLHGRGKPAE